MPTWWPRKKQAPEKFMTTVQLMWSSWQLLNLWGDQSSNGGFEKSPSNRSTECSRNKLGLLVLLVKSVSVTKIAIYIIPFTCVLFSEFWHTEIDFKLFRKISKYTSALFSTFLGQFYKDWKYFISMLNYSSYISRGI